VSSLRFLQIKERDLKIIRLVHAHRFLRSSHILSLIAGSRQNISRRLQCLYHHGYLERPRAQIDYYHRGGSRRIVYGLGNKGASLLKQQTRGIRWGEKNRAVGRQYLEHAVLVSDVMVAIELACRKTQRVRLFTREEFPKIPKSTRWSVTIGTNVKLGVIPDQMFGLEITRETGQMERAYFFLEADRGTMPVIRKNLNQTSLYRKLLAYEATWSQDLHRSLFGIHRFRVLTVTKSAERVRNLVDACQKLKRGHGLFLFADETTLKTAQSLLNHPWQSGRTQEKGTLLD
jgi:hypothetical protein